MIEGKLHFHSETGTEGGMWALQADDAITYEKPDYGAFAGSTVYDPERPERKGKVSEAWHQDGRAVGDPLMRDPDYYKSSLFQGQRRGDREADARLEHRWGFRFVYDDKWPGTPRTDPDRHAGIGTGQIVVLFIQWEDAPLRQRFSDVPPEPVIDVRRSDEVLVERWSYDGLHILADGDYLEILGEDGDVEWEGEIKLRKVDLFTEDAGGMWLRHGEQESFSKDDWAHFFFKGYRGRLGR